MKRKLSLKLRFMLTTSILLIIFSIGFTFFSILNSYLHIYQPFESMILEQVQGSQQFLLQQDIVIQANTYFINSLIFMIIAIVIGCAFTYVVAKYSLNPLKIWSKEISQIDQNKLSYRIQNANTHDELDVLVDSFNHLLDRLQWAFDREKRFSAAAAHELKTPLSVVKANLELLAMEDEPQVEEVKEAFTVIQKQNDRMIQLVNDLMVLSSNQESNNQNIEFDTIFEEIFQEIHSSLLEKNIHIELNKINVVLKGNAVLMKHAISNLIQNAIKYNEQNGSIKVVQTLNSSYYQVAVYDTGIGIIEEDQQHIFEPFYRADKSRNRSIAGAGLGLAITKEIIDQHNGQIKVMSNYPKGSIFIITLPLNN